MRLLLSSLLFLVGTAISLTVVVLNICNLIQTRRRVLPILFLLVSGIFAYSQVANLLYQASPLACAIVPDRTLILSGALILLHLCFLYISNQINRTREHKGERKA